MSEPISERRIRSDDMSLILGKISAVVDTLHIHTTDIAVLKTRMDGNDSDIKKLESHVSAMFERLTQHMMEEEKSIRKIMLGIGTLIFSGIGAILWDIFKSRVGM